MCLKRDRGILISRFLAELMSEAVAGLPPRACTGTERRFQIGSSAASIWHHLDPANYVRPRRISNIANRPGGCIYRECESFLDRIRNPGGRHACSPGLRARRRSALRRRQAEVSELMTPLPRALRWAVPFRIPFVLHVLSGVCNIRTAWLLSRGGLTSPTFKTAFSSALKNGDASETECSVIFGTQLRCPLLFGANGETLAIHADQNSAQYETSACLALISCAQLVC
jgi:hypothetical protein